MYYKLPNFNSSCLSEMVGQKKAPKKLSKEEQAEQDRLAVIYDLFDGISRIIDGTINTLHASNIAKFTRIWSHTLEHMLRPFIIEWSLKRPFIRLNSSLNLFTQELAKKLCTIWSFPCCADMPAEKEFIRMKRLDQPTENCPLLRQLIREGSDINCFTEVCQKI